ncbi:MAG: shikimate kinase, partial [Bacteroidia bacterium]|nr:shikimate kinase [Bacteroidia bacterium]
MVLVLIGYMASGKSQVGRKLALMLNYNFIDLDDYIEEKENMSVSNIFKNKGEIYFRKLETDHLNSLLSKQDHVVLALGGGTPCYSNNMDSIINSKNLVSIYLKATIKTLCDRLLLENAKRPLISHLNTKEELSEFIGKHLFERSPFYSKADYTIETDLKSINEVIEEIVFK